jgi:hypothetical protein
MAHTYASTQISLAVQAVLTEVGLEAERGKKTWGQEFDRRNTLNDWVVYAMSFATDAARMETTMKAQDRDLRKAAGILISALVMLKTEGFAPRHYEGQTAPKSLPEIDS